MPGPALRAYDNGVILAVLVRPGSRDRRFVAEIGEETIVLNLQAPAREGRANVELIKKLGKVMDLSTGELTIVSGHRSRDKTLMIRSRTVQQVMDALKAALNA